MNGFSNIVFYLRNTVFTFSENSDRVFGNLKFKFFCFGKYLITDIVRRKIYHITATIAGHMFMVTMIMFYFIAFRASSYLDFSYDTKLSKQFYISKYTGSSDIWKMSREIMSCKNMLFIHIFKQLYPLRSGFIFGRSKYIYNIHSWDWVSIKWS